MFTNFYEAYNFVSNHGIFNGNFLKCLSIEVVKVNPSTHEISSVESENTLTNVWLECGQYSSKYSIHDLELDCGADTFEEAIIRLANLVKNKYGDEFEWFEPLD